ncbi:MAG: HEPN domain-containing protein [Candidatus Anstonellaceae archaeon]
MDELGGTLQGRLLKDIPKSADRAKKSLEAAEEYLKEAKAAVSVGANAVGVMGAYSCAFHAARAVLFLDGVAERSHVAVYEYLREKHPELGSGQVSAFSLYRKMRHSVAYGLAIKVKDGDGKEVLTFAEEFFENVRNNLKGKL